jgi:regulator of cell morphogenesis and NO signaling
VTDVEDAEEPHSMGGEAVKASVDLLPIDMTVNETIRRYPRTVEVFRRFGVDACCGGASPIVEAAARADVDVVTLMRALLHMVREAA